MPSNPIRREFLGWEQPALAEAARRLAARYQSGRSLDLGRVIVVVPGQRAGRRLQELLAFLAEDAGLRLTPPAVVTEGKVPELLYTPRLPFADDLTQELAWAQALREMRADRRRLIAPYPPAREETLSWLELGKLFRRLHVELAADGLNFTDVVRKLPKESDAAEGPRWQALAALQQRYLEILDKQELWDLQTARLVAIEKSEIRSDHDFVLLAAVDLNQSLRKMLDQVAEQVTAYVIAPPERADHFDAHGCLVPEAWCGANVPLRQEHLVQVDGPQEQAEAVTTWLADLGGRFRQDEVAIGVPDEVLVPQLQRQLEQCGVRARWVEGTRIGETLPYQLLTAAVHFAAERRYADLAALVRHPDVEDWLTETGKPGTLPAQLDVYYNLRLPSRVRAGSITPNADRWPDLAGALQRIDRWLEDASAQRPLRSWGEVFRKLLGVVYGGRTLKVDQPGDEVFHRVLKRILELCDGLGELPVSHDGTAWTAADAFQAGLGSLAREWLPPPADADALEILGWLELPLDDSRALVVTSFNEGFVPTSSGADAFLPDGLRRVMGLLSNERRYARDAYAATVLCHARSEVRCIFARRDSNNDPLRPSRLIFACPDDELVARAGDFFGSPKQAVTPRRLLLADGQKIPASSGFVRPAPVKPEKTLERIRVTQFRDYLACPYRFYLRHVCDLEAIDDSAPELDGGAFGTLLHRVLGNFGRESSGPRHSDRLQDIENFLFDGLSMSAKGMYGAELRRPAVRLQLEQARQRLRAFAARQCELVRGGWRIAYAEDDAKNKDTLSCEFAVDSGKISLIGRIDRIDFHEATRTLRILDYKTSDRAKSPEKTHRNSKGWLDLQLPLYRHLYREIQLKVSKGCKVELGYFNLPKQASLTGVETAQWDEVMLGTADETARMVIRNLWQGVYLPMAEKPPAFSEDFAGICLDNSRPPALPVEQEGAEE